jgi:hypothetical protein
VNTSDKRIWGRVVKIESIDSNFKTVQMLMSTGVKGASTSNDEPTSHLDFKESQWLNVNDRINGTHHSDDFRSSSNQCSAGELKFRGGFTGNSP